MEKSDQKIVIYWSWKKTVSLIAAILLVPTLFVWIFSLTLKTTIISPNYYKGVIKSADTYNRLIRDGIPSLVLGSTISEDTTTDWLAKELIVFVVQKAIDPAWLQGLTDTTIDQIVTFLSSEDKTGKKVELDLTQASGFLSKANASLGLISQMVPTCSGDQTEVAGISCKDIDSNQIKQSVADIQKKIADFNLGAVDLGKDINQVNSAVSFIQKFVRNVNSYFWFTTIFAIILIATIVFLSLKDLYYLTRFVVIPLVIAPILSFIVVLLLMPLASSDYSNVSFNLPPEMNAIIADVLKYFTSGIFHRLEIIALIVLLVALAGYITILVLEKKIPALRRT